jgi:predicted short-subunit dehydrogenase-like oxidoreductase (DUF2520 family)
MTKAIRVNLVGSGNVATHLSKALFAGGVEIVSVYSRNFVNARALSHQFGAKAVDSITDLDSNVDLNIVTVKDGAIASVAAMLDKSVPVVHSSGAASIHLFDGFAKYGVLYPLQTFSKERALDIAAIPFLVEANTPDFEDWIIEFSQKHLSEHARKADSLLRGKIHLAAVFACNFTTQLLQEADLLLRASELDLSLLHPLIRETMEKTLELGPESAMTGPARRGDLLTIEKHLAQLEDEELKLIYQVLSKRIIEGY